MTVWFSSDAMSAWRPEASGQPGGQRRFSDTAIETALTLRLVFGLPFRQTEGFLRSILALTDADLDAPDHTTLSRRSQSLDVNLHVTQELTPVDRVVGRERLTVAREHPASLRCPQPFPGRPEHGDQQRLHVPRRHIDHEARRLTGGDGLEMLANTIDVPIREKRRPGLQHRPRLLDERTQGSFGQALERLGLDHGQLPYVVNRCHRHPPSVAVRAAGPAGRWPPAAGAGGPPRRATRPR